MPKKKVVLIKMIYVAMFSALCFAGTCISIPIGASKVHLGNFFCLLGGLLCGGLVGGLSGAIGMTLNDIVFGYPYDTFLRTMVLKFLMGFIVGTLFRFMLKHKANGTLFSWISTALLGGLFAYSLTMFLTESRDKYLWTMVFSAILFGLVLFSAIFSFKLNNVLKCISFSIIVALCVNVVGEFYIRIFFNTLVHDMIYETALATSVSKLPGALFTSVVSMVFVIPIFYPLYRATYKINKLNDLKEYIEPAENK